jgi:hypothetical protein
MNYEIFSGNSLYGHDSILKSYCGFPMVLPLPVSLQHGWATVVATPDWYLRSRLETVWVWCKNDHDALFEKGGRRIVIGGAPFIYMLEKRRKLKTPPKRKGTIVFPAHSTKNVGTILDFEQYAEMLLQLPGELHPITVNMYWYDMELGNDKPFKDRGLRVVTCGKSENADFLKNFILFSDTHRYACSNRISTSAFYAMYLGLGVFKYGPDVAFKNYSDTFLPTGIITSINTDTRRKELEKYFSIDFIEKTDWQFEICANELGLSYKLSKDKMLRIFLEKIDESYIFQSWHRNKPFVRVIKRNSRVNRVLSKSKIIISGSGSHTRELFRDFPLLKKKVIAISTIDSSREAVEDIPVIDESEISGMDYEAVLISSHSFEKDIYRRLKERGIPVGKIFRIYSEDNE